ncbi:hypothetical protein J5T34_07890 [Cupriavidus gilardii]|uniref:hypothetical protein n=1 Tax=Cupriavidus gilardii TaxID=82541 RepID=UPI001ABEBCB2|nr:hypothetical protein [Cupriavidus gilardii]MBO4120657.1 hypothetical protein [Cupriavidus gilardii]
MDPGNDEHYGGGRVVRGQRVDTSGWPTPDEGALDDPRRALYFSRKHAVQLYLSGADAHTIKRLTSFSDKQVYRLISERCLQAHPDGQPYGWRGLVPWLRVRPYRRRTKIRVDRFGGGAAGALQATLDAHPELRLSFESRIRSSPSSKRLSEAKRSPRRHWLWFLDQLRERGYEARGDWPFNTSTRAYFTICRFVEQVLSSDPKSLAASIGGADLVRKLKAGDGSGRPALRFMQRVEMDAHKLDGRFCVSLPLAGGGFTEKIVHRLWVIVILEVVSRAVVGYYFSTGREVSKDDVLRAIKTGLSRPKLRPVTFSDTPYLPGAGLLGSLGEDFVGLCWDETSVDGALAETCQHVRAALQQAVGSTLLEPRNSFAARRSKDDRPFIESFFRNLAGRGFQRLTNTTGAKPQDRQGREPDGVALASRFQYEYAEELLGVLIANYNATPHRGIGNRTPLQYAAFLHRHGGETWRRVDAAAMQGLFSVRRRCVVRGGAAVGRAPYVNFHYGRYSNEVLHNRQDLVGTEIWVICHEEDDCRVALASTLDGVPLGVLRAAPPWHLSPHSLAVRAAICRACARGQFAISPGGDAIEAFIQYVEMQPHKKLPVHPAYLEARRILAAASQLSIGAVMLDAALERGRGGSSRGGQAPEVAPAVTRADTTGDLGTDRKGELPPRRMARTE